MKSIFTFLTILLATFSSFAQAPNRISYQAEVRNGSNNLVVNQLVRIRISILQGSNVGASVYTETHAPTTNANGLVSLQIGGGTTSGNFANINWANGPFFLKTETDPTGGTNYTINGTNQLLSVPYALYSNKAGNGMSNGTANNQMLYWNGTAWVILTAPLIQGQVLTYCNGALVWTIGGICPGTITSLICASATPTGTLTSGTVPLGVIRSVPYGGGNGGPHNGQTVNSTGVTGLIATLVPGFFANGPGDLIYNITGSTATSGIASFVLNIGGKSCTLTITVNTSSLPINIETALIPAGTYTMGSPATEPQRATNEVQHQVTLSAFRMSKYEISNAQFATFLNAKNIGSNGKYALGAYPEQMLIFQNSIPGFGLTWTGSQWQPVTGKENFPANNVSWYGATEFATYAGGRLPTEAQWEYACRGNTTTRYNTGACLSNTQANYFWADAGQGCTNTNTTYPGQTQAVNSYGPNSYGLFNMHGNVWEWCSDWYGAYTTTAQTNPTGPITGNSRVVRGGTWNDYAFDCRSAERGSYSPGNSVNTGGFRVAFAP